MAANSMDWVQGPWSVQLHTVNVATYDRLDLRNRTFPHWIISYVKEGDVETGTGADRRRVRSGGVMLHPPHLPFFEYAGAGGKHIWMQVDIQCAHQLDLLQLYRIPPVVGLRDPARFEAVFHKLRRAWENRGAIFRDLKLTSGVLELMELILDGWEKEGCPERPAAYDSPGDRFARLIGQMSMRLRDKLTREQLAEFVRLNPNYLDRAFQRQYGITPMRMLRDMRLGRSKQLLARSEGTLESIADECGMTDASYLCKQFKKQYGVLPGEYRQAVREAQAEDIYRQYHLAANGPGGGRHV